MGFDYHLTFDNPYAFKAHCHQISISAFDVAITKQEYPSRYRLLYFAVYDTSYLIAYLFKKMIEFAQFTWNLSYMKTPTGDTLGAKVYSTIALLAALHLTAPFVCTALRVFSSILGLLHPKFALYGWKVVEAFEKSSYDLWSQFHQTLPGKAVKEMGCQNIEPANAIHYLDLKKNRARLAPREPEELKKIENETRLIFSELLNHIASANSDCFAKLLIYQEAVKLPPLVKHTTYHLSNDVKTILSTLAKLCANDTSSLLASGHKTSESADALLVKKICTANLNMEILSRLYDHIHINLEQIVEDMKLDSVLVKVLFTKLEDLFRLRFDFGRAHYPQANCDLCIS